MVTTGLTHDGEKDKRVRPDPETDRLASFKAGWSKADDGEEFTEETLESLSWHNLGWRLGTLFGETLTERQEELYLWCVKQQREWE